MKGDGAAAVVRAKEVRWARKPESITSCSRRGPEPAFEESTAAEAERWNLRRKMREERS